MAAITLWLLEKDRGEISNTFVAVVKCMDPNRVASTYISVGKQNSPPEWVGDMGSEPFYLSSRLPTPHLKISAGKSPRLTSHPSGNCCVVSGRGSNQAVLIKIFPTNLNTIKNWYQLPQNLKIKLNVISWLYCKKNIPVKITYTHQKSHGSWSWRVTENRARLLGGKL